MLSGFGWSSPEGGVCGVYMCVCVALTWTRRKALCVRVCRTCVFVLCVCVRERESFQCVCVYLCVISMGVMGTPHVSRWIIIEIFDASWPPFEAIRHNLGWGWWFTFEFSLVQTWGLLQSHGQLWLPPTSCVAWLTDPISTLLNHVDITTQHTCRVGGALKSRDHLAGVSWGQLQQFVATKMVMLKVGGIKPQLGS